MNLGIFLLWILMTFGIVLFIHGLSKLVKERKAVNDMKYNDLVKLISEREGKKVEVNVAQIKEVLTITLSVIANLSYTEAAQLLKKYQDFE